MATSFNSRTFPNKPGAIRTILGKGGGSYVDGYPSLAALYNAVAKGDLPLPRPASAETARLTAPKVPK